MAPGDCCSQNWDPSASVRGLVDLASGVCGGNLASGWRSGVFSFWCEEWGLSL